VRRFGALLLCVAGLVVMTGPALAWAKPLTKAEFIEQADALCGETDQYLGFVTLAIQAEGPPSDVQVQEFATYLVPAYRELITEIRALDEPKADRARVNKLLTTLGRELDAIEEDPLRLRRGEPFPKAAKLADRYGFEVCGAS
jgi:hypothetical protein